ncbi:MAG: hypothetical protein AAF704_00940 [Cyanobacteria bacterium P01_D01_bin.123]
MSPEKQERLQACLDEAAAISYADSDSEILTSLEAIEAQCVARYSLTSALTWQFLYLPKHRHEPWPPRKLRSCIGQFRLTQAQAERLHLVQLDVNNSTVQTTRGLSL